MTKFLRSMLPKKKKVEHDDHEFNWHEEGISSLVRLVVLGWTGAILTLNYVSIPGIPQQKIDPTFIASVFTGTLATFGVQATKKKEDAPTIKEEKKDCLLYTSPSPRDATLSRMPSSA